ncbi:PaaI family thioesterase [Parvularcula sp. IMCC14364]|uniref:PaaI family thioesterase n=1 Tax=Parvularcula sp. IMCC14364 TaxID=3067902 RepID=UPI0027415A2F|nr:PaaI family thioesterase [Parvularcula sp. IMCC14364]
MSDDMKDAFNQMAPPFAKLLGMKVTNATRERVVAELFVSDELTTATPILHGGAIMALADNLGAMGTILNLPSGATTTTIESKTNLMGSVPAGEIAYADATPLHIGRSTQVWQTRVTRENGKLAAIVTQTQMVKLLG